MLARAVTGLASQRVNSLDALPDFVAQLESLPEGAIPAACRADLLAVAGTRSHFDVPLQAQRPTLPELGIRSIIIRNYPHQTVPTVTPPPHLAQPVRFPMWPTACLASTAFANVLPQVVR